MKKKMLFGIGALAVIAMLTLNINVAKENKNGQVSVGGIETVANADAESIGYYLMHFICPDEGVICPAAEYGNNYWHGRYTG